MTADAPKPSLWHNPDFMKLWVGQTISEIGSRITREGMGLTALMTLDASATQLGWLNAAASVPVLLLGLPAGAWVDRLRRRPILIAADLGRALLLFTIPLAAVLGLLRFAQLLIVIVLINLLTIFFDTAYRAYLPALVARDQLMEGNSQLSVGASTAEVIGPTLAGALIQTLSAPIAIFFDALSFVASAIFIAFIRKAEPAPLANSSVPPNLRQEIIVGLRLTFTHPVLRALVGAATTQAFFGGFIGTLYGLYVIRELGMGPALLGMMVSVGGVSALIGALFAERVAQQLGIGATLISMMFITALFVLLIPLAGGAWWVAAMIMMLSQLGDFTRTIYFIHETSLRQLIAPEGILGRVNASAQLLVTGVGPLGALLGGVLGDSLGVRPTLFIAAAGMALAGLWLIASPVRGMRALREIQ